MLLEALQNFEWYNEPDNVVFRDKELCVTAQPQTDFWQSKHHHFSRDNGHLFFMRENGDFTFNAKWEFDVQQAACQCGVMVRIDENNWVKAALIYDNPERPMIGSSVTQNGYSDWAAQDIAKNTNQILFKLRRFQGDYIFSYSLDGEKYIQLRMVHLLNDLSEVKVGAYVCAPSAQPFEAVLSQIDLSKEVRK